eukprot:m.91575 g.91575  ORF g.91575 m.91575 type:complete len:1033 (+) comp8493_c0_seq4:3093-6191(+)
MRIGTLGATGGHFMDPEVLIVGAGISGIAAARELRRCGFRAVILEARNRTGGRVFSHAFVPGDHRRVNLGANFVHGCDPDAGNILFNFAEDQQLHMVPAGHENDRWIFANGEVATPRTVEKVKLLYESVDQALVALADKRFQAGLPDITVREGLVQVLPQFQDRLPDASYVDLFEAMLVSQHAYAASAEQLSLFDMLFLIRYGAGGLDGGDRVLPSGFATIVERLEIGLDIRLLHEVEAITQDEQGCVLHCKTPFGNVQMRANRVVVTASIGVLKSGIISFSPPLSPAKLLAIDKLGMGLENRVALHFTDRFWRTKGIFLHPAGLPYGLRIYNLFETAGINVLLLFFAPPFSWIMEGKSDDEILDMCLADLGRLFRARLTRECLEPNGYVITRWGSDRFARGSYSFVPLGGKIQMVDDLLRAEGRVHFAGEGTASDDMQLSHGAYSSGLRVAEEIIWARLYAQGEVPPRLLPPASEGPLKHMAGWVQMRLHRWRAEGDLSAASITQLSRACGFTEAAIRAWLSLIDQSPSSPQAQAEPAALSASGTAPASAAPSATAALAPLAARVAEADKTTAAVAVVAAPAVVDATAGPRLLEVGSVDAGEMPSSVVHLAAAPSPTVSAPAGIEPGVVTSAAAPASPAAPVHLLRAAPGQRAPEGSPGQPTPTLEHIQSDEGRVSPTSSAPHTVQPASDSVSYPADQFARPIFESDLPSAPLDFATPPPEAASFSEADSAILQQPFATDNVMSDNCAPVVVRPSSRPPDLAPKVTDAAEPEAGVARLGDVDCYPGAPMSPAGADGPGDLITWVTAESVSDPRATPEAMCDNPFVADGGDDDQDDQPDYPSKSPGPDRKHRCIEDTSASVEPAVKTATQDWPPSASSPEPKQLRALRVPLPRRSSSGDVTTAVMIAPVQSQPTASPPSPLAIPAEPYLAADESVPLQHPPHPAHAFVDPALLPLSSLSSVPMAPLALPPLGAAPIAMTAVGMFPFVPVPYAMHPTILPSGMSTVMPAGYPGAPVLLPSPFAPMFPAPSLSQ